MAATIRLVLAALTATAVGACTASSGGDGDAPGGFRRSLGLAAPPPDEFLIVSREPLQAPPDFRTLPAPQLGAPSRVERNPQVAAQAALGGAGAPVAAAPAPSAGESGLLAAAGADAADPSIRETLEGESAPGERRFGLDSLFGFPIVQDPEAEAERLDPEAEADRLRAQGVQAPVAPPREDDATP